jgi:ubiquinone biosynthesis protein UbiJ
MPLNQITASALQTFVNKTIALDAEAGAKLDSLNDKVIHLQISDFQLNYYFQIINREILVSSSFEQAVSASITGTLPAFVAAATSEHSADSIFKGELNFSGEINVAKQFQAFAQSLDIDWHEPLAQLLGDPIGHSVAVGISKLSGWLKSSANSSREDISEYLQEEARVTPSETEQELFFQQVDQARSQADRLKARLDRLTLSFSLNTIDGEQ